MILLLLACSFGPDDTSSPARPADITWYSETYPCELVGGSWVVRWEAPEAGLVLVTALDWSPEYLTWTPTGAYSGYGAGAWTEFRCASGGIRGETVTVTWGVVG